MAEVIYYFNAITNPVWSDPDNIVDGDIETFGYAIVGGLTQILTGNTCPITDLGIITKVELRLFGKGDGDDRIDITPDFTLGNGDTHEITPVVSPGGWSAYIDITNDTNHPDWSSWAQIPVLDCIIDSVLVGEGNTLYCAKVEIRVTYTPILKVTSQAVTDIELTTATGHGTIVSIGAENPSKRGVCWNTTGNPTVADDKSEETDSFGTGVFSRPMTGLIPSTHYYVKAYAYDLEGYVYGGQVEFYTSWQPPVSDIDVGADPVARLDSCRAGSTYVDKNNPANASGTLSSVKVWAEANITGLIVGTFYITNGNTLKCRDSVLIGDVEAGAERTFTDLSIAVEEGDYIGCYFTGGFLEFDPSGYAGFWLGFGKYIDPNDEAEYTFFAGRALSLYGYGDIVVGWTGKISGVTNPAKIMGVDVANIAKVKGVAST